MVNKKHKTTNKKFMALWIDENITQRLKIVAIQKNTNMSDIIRKLIVDYLEKEEKQSLMRKMT